MSAKKAKVFRPTAFAFPYVGVTIVFVIVPLVLVLVYAFIGEDGSFSIDNFIRVFTDEQIVSQLGKTLGIAALSTAICLLIAYPVAFILASSPFNKMAIFALLFVIPMWINFMLRMLALESVLFAMGISKGLTAVIVGMVYDFFPYMLLPIYTVLLNMDKSYVEASKDLGANGIRTFFKVTLPLSVPGIISGISMMFMPIFSSYAITDMLGNSNVSVIGIKIDELFGQMNYGDGSAIAFVLLLLVLAVMVIGTVITRKTDKSLKGGGKV